MNVRPAPERKRLHRESLLQIPLVRAAFGHPTLRPRARAVDLRWRYQRLVERRLSGFQPLSSSVYYGRHSRVADWLRRPEGSARPFNDGDHLVSEALFCAHDFVHAWALAVVRPTLPELLPTRARDLETLAFVHLATEAAATVGLDYWYLCTREPSEICDIGALHFPLTTRFHERYLGEYRRFCPTLTVQTPEFFSDFTTFYCTGRWEGFSEKDLTRSPRLSQWMTQETTYGERQREYIRTWIAFMAGTAAHDRDPGRPVRCDAPWQRAMIRTLGEALWQLVHSGEGALRRPGDALVRWPRLARPFDPRFVNVRAMSPEAVLASARNIHEPMLRGYVCEQLLCSHEFDGFDRRLIPALKVALAAHDLPALVALLRGVPRVPTADDEPELVFLLA